MPYGIEQLRRLPKSSVVVRNVDSIACRSLGGMAQWLASFNVRPCGLRVFCSWMVAGHEPKEIMDEVHLVVESRVRLI
jgi:hypothetical protein